MLVDRDGYRIEVERAAPPTAGTRPGYQLGDLVRLEPIGCTLLVDEVFAAAAEA